MLCGPHIFPDENDIQIGSVTDFAAAEFSHRHDREIALATPQPIHKNQAGFRQRGMLGEKRNDVREPEHVAKKNSQELDLPIGAE